MGSESQDSKIQVILSATSFFNHISLSTHKRKTIMNTTNNDRFLSSQSFHSMTTSSTLSTACKERRKAIVSRKFESPSCSFRVESQKAKKRNMLRRYAITKYTSEFPLHYMKALRKLYQEESVNPETVGVTYLGENTMKRNNIILFDENDNLVSTSNFSNGASFFASMIAVCYKESYQFCNSSTHKSITRSTTLNEMRNHGFIFAKSSLYRRGIVYVLDDMNALRMIRLYLKIEGTKRTRCSVYA